MKLALALLFLVGFVAFSVAFPVEHADDYLEQNAAEENPGLVGMISIKTILLISRNAITVFDALYCKQFIHRAGR